MVWGGGCGLRFGVWFGVEGVVYDSGCGLGLRVWSTILGVA